MVVARDEAERERLREIESRALAQRRPGRALAGRGGAAGDRAGRGRASRRCTRPRRRSSTTRRWPARWPARSGARRPGAARRRRSPRSSRAATVTVRAGRASTGSTRLVVCAGLQSDLVARLAGDGADPVIVPFRGEYYRLVPRARRPGPRAGLSGAGPGVPVPRRALHPAGRRHRRHRTERGAGHRPGGLPASGRGAGRAGRDAALAAARGGCSARTGGPGCASCAGRSRSARTSPGPASYVPALRPADVVGAPAGVRAQAVDPDGSLVDDFRISRLGPVVAVRNAPSPGGHLLAWPSPSTSSTG